MHNLENVVGNKVFGPNKRQRKVVATSDSEKALDRVNKSLGIGMTWVAGLSMLYLLAHMLRWVSNG